MTAQKITFFLALSSFFLFAKPLSASLTCDDIERPNADSAEEISQYITKLIRQQPRVIGINDNHTTHLRNRCQKLIVQYKQKLIVQYKEESRQGAEERYLLTHNNDSNATSSNTSQTSAQDDGVCGGLPEAGSSSEKELDRHIKNAENKKRSLGDPWRTEASTANGTTTTQRVRNPDIANQIEVCDQIIEAYQEEKGKREKCTEAVTKMQESQTDFRRSCGGFSGGKTKCVDAIEACDKCPDKENYGDYDCVYIHKNTKCSALSGKDLETAKEKRESIEEDINKLKEEIEEQEKDILSKEEELKDAMTEIEQEFIEYKRSQEKGLEESKSALDEGMRKGQAHIDENLAKQLASAQKQIDSHLKIVHSFENAIYKANREYRQERRQIVRECENQARADLARYRKRRRSRIEKGSWKTSLSSYLERGRKSFADQDYIMFQKYLLRCRERRKTDFNEVLADYKQKLRIIEQQKEQYLDALAKQKKQLAGLNQQADKAGKQLLKDYTEQMGKLLTRYHKEYEAAVQDYKNKKKGIVDQTKGLALLEAQLRRKVHSLKSKKNELLREKEVISYLKSRGVSDEDSGDAKQDFAEAYAQLEEFKGDTDIARNTCHCDETREGSHPNQDKCRRIDRARDSVASEDSLSETPYEYGRFDRSRSTSDDTAGNR